MAPGFWENTDNIGRALYVLCAIGLLGAVAWFNRDKPPPPVADPYRAMYLTEGFQSGSDRDGGGTIGGNDEFWLLTRVDAVGSPDDESEPFVTEWDQEVWCGEYEVHVRELGVLGPWRPLNNLYSMCVWLDRHHAANARWDEAYRVIDYGIELSEDELSALEAAGAEIPDFVDPSRNEWEDPSYR